MPVDLSELAAEASDDLLRVRLALLARLERDREPAASRRGVGAIGADERGDAVDVRIGADDVGDRALASIMAGNETSGGASVIPRRSPVSCWGKSPFGIDHRQQRT